MFFKPVRFCLVVGLTAILCISSMPARANLSMAELMQQGQAAYGLGQYQTAVTLWQQATQQGTSLARASGLSNLGLAYLKLGDYNSATTVIDEALALVMSTQEKDHQRVLAQVLSTQGKLYMAQGQLSEALDVLRQATTAYELAGDRAGVWKSQLNQVQILRGQGHYRQALQLITAINDVLQTEPDSKLKVVSLQTLGNLMRLATDPLEAQAVLQQSLALSQQLKLADSEAMSLVHLGNISDTLNQPDEAVEYYKQAGMAATNASVNTRLQALVNAFGLLIREEQSEQAKLFVPKIRELLAQAPPSRLVIYSQINFTQSILEAELPLLSMRNIAQLAAMAVEQARLIGDVQAESYALGNLGAIYEHTGQIEDAIRLTEQALELAQVTNAGHILYQWQWQLGRLYKVAGQREQAIAAYGGAIATLQTIRQDLVSVNPEVRFSFREGVEPIYRQLVSLLLDTPAGIDTKEENLLQARNVIESLQLEELVNFFRADCVVENPVQIDQVDQRATVVYPIVLDDRLEVVLSLPGRALKHYSADAPKIKVDQTIVSLLNEIFYSPEVFTASRSRFVTSEEAWQQETSSGSAPRQQTDLFLPYAQQLYDWIIAPLEADLTAAETETLVFVLDGKLRNLPMAVLHDGSQYLVEKYGIALTPGLQLLEPQPLRQGSLQTIVAGLSEGRQGFTPLPGVAQEIEAIRQQVRSKVLFNESFVGNAFRGAIDETAFPVVHLATHGQFSSDPDETFILTWDDRINVNELSSLLQTSEISREQPIELLILSACETATGDDRAALGLAGVAVRSGARSTLATLWPVDDFSTAEFMGQLYSDLASLEASRSEMLRQAQLRLLRSDNYNHPFFWAPFVLVGNWL